PHNGLSTVRPARAWVEDPRGGPLLKCVEADILRGAYLSPGRGGWLSERRGFQLQFWTSFGTHGLPARTGAGTTTSDAAAIFDIPKGTSGWGRTIFTAGNP